MRVAFEEELLLNVFRKNIKYFPGFFSQAVFDEFFLFFPGRQFVESVSFLSRPAVR